MSPDDFYRRARRLASPLHPRRLYHRAKRVAHAVGILPAWYRLRKVAAVAHPRRLARTVGWGRAVYTALRRRRAEPRLTVAVDINAFWEPLTGIGWYLYRLLEALAERDDLRLRLYGPNLIDTPDLPQPVVVPPTGRAIEIVAWRVPRDLSLDYVWLVNFLRRRTAKLIAFDRNEILFAPNYFLPPWFDRCDGRLVVTVHDLGFLRVPWTLRESTRIDLETRLAATLARAAEVLTDSETVLGELLESGLVEPGRVHSVHLGPGSASVAAAPAELPAATPERYVLHVGTLEPRKNLGLLLAAWRRLRARGADPPPLVFCGRFGWKADDLRAAVEEAEGEGWLHHFGYLADAEVAALYAGALFVVLPSIYEGFGLPAVEAMVAGAPLLLSDIPVLREVGGDAALYASPENPEVWAKTAARLIDNAELRRALQARGSERVKLFDWQRTAKGTAEVWFRAVESREG